MAPLRAVLILRWSHSSRLIYALVGQGRTALIETLRDKSLPSGSECCNEGVSTVLLFYI